MLVNKTVEFFLSEVAGWSWRSARAEAGIGTRYRRGPRLGPGRDAGGGRGRDWNEIPAGAEAEQAGSSERPETGRDAGGG